MSYTKNVIFSRYTFFDYATQTYLAITGCLIAFFQFRAASFWPLLLAIHLIVILLIHGLIQWHTSRPNNLPLSILRHFYPLLLYTGFYRETAQLNQLFYSGYLDPLFLRLEMNLFGFQPGLELMSRHPHLLISEILYASYFSYYVMLLGGGIILFYRDRAQFLHYVSLLSFLLYVCYLLYIFLPVVGPRITMIEIPGYELPSEWRLTPDESAYPLAIQSGIFYKTMKWLYAGFEGPGAAFPSSHVAAALCTLYFSWKYLKRSWAVFHGVLVLLLCVATVYCRYHYAIDVMAGILTALVVMPFGNWLYFLFQNRDKNALTHAA